jgi:hypothetical protein
MSIAPSRSVPLHRVVNRLLDDIQASLPACRKSWWTTKRTTCLAKQWAMVPDSAKIELLPGPIGDARQIADASYDPDHERLRVAFRDGTTADVSIRP